MKDRIIDLALDRGRSVLLIIFGVLAFGVLARLSMPVENEPRIDIPFFVITIVHEGISPLDAARLLVMPLEVELKSVEGVREVRGMGAENLAIVSVEFTAQTDLDVALGDVREAVNRAKEELPPTAEEPIVAATATANYPLLQINLVGKGTPERTMLSLARRLRDRIEAIPDVQEVKLQGSREEFMEILVSPAGMQTYNLSVEQLLLELTRNNQLIPAGELESGSGSLSLKIPSVVDRPEDLFDLLVMVDGDTVVTLKDIASVRRTFKDRTSYSHANGEPSTSLFVHLRKQANRIETAEAVRELVDTFRPQLPNSVSMFISGDYSEFSQTQVVEMQGNIVTALLLVIIVVIPAMGFRNSLIVAFSIPVSFLLALTVLWLLGETYNFMVMFGMLLGLGMLIDGAIVVCEDADRRFSVGGGDLKQAYGDAAKRMFLPVTSSTATTLAAFVPLMFWPGVAGSYMAYLPVSVLAVLLSGLLYALVFVPVIGVTMGGRSGKLAFRSAQADIWDVDLHALKGFRLRYAQMLSMAVRHPFATLAIALAVV